MRVLTKQLGRIESAVDVLAIEVERITEAQRFTARQLAGRERSRIPPPLVQPPESRQITPH